LQALVRQPAEKEHFFENGFDSHRKTSD
jgi:hypothetical protein